MIKDYKDDINLRLSFNELAGKVFSIDFERWYQLGFWNNQYVCYSFTDHDQVIANVSVSKMNIILNGKKIRAIQIGTVMTHPDHRKKDFQKN